MVITDNFLTVNKYIRPGIKRKDTLAVVLHWVDGTAKKSALNIKDYFETLPAKQIYGSTQYVIGWQGEAIRMMPEAERANHCGSMKIDPASGKIYTDLSRELFGFYATDPLYSPSYCTIGIEMCHEFSDGRFSKATLTSAMDLCVEIFKRYPNLDPMKHLVTHEEVVGYKFCPLWFVKHPNDFLDFKRGLAMRLAA